MMYEVMITIKIPNPESPVDIAESLREALKEFAPEGTEVLHLWVAPKKL
jgi:hypothetical protein